MRKKPSPKTRKDRKPTDIKRLSHRDAPASVGVVYEIRDELLAEIRSTNAKVESHDSRFDLVDAKFDSVDAKFDSVDAKFDSVDARFDSLDAKIDSVRHDLRGEIQQVLVAVHRTQTLMEEQRSENRIVLDGLKYVIERQDRIEGVTPRI